MARHLSTHFAELGQLLRSTGGIGPVASATLIADLPELGHLTRRQIAALVGAAPFAWDSGQMHGLRRIYGGCFEIRRTLYMATLTAARHHPVIRAHDERLVAAGKLMKVAGVACTRELLTILNAMAWRKHAAPSILITFTLDETDGYSEVAQCLCRSQIVFDPTADGALSTPAELYAVTWKYQVPGASPLTT